MICKTIFAKYSKFINIFFKMLALKLFKHLDIKDYTIDLKKN